MPRPAKVPHERTIQALLAQPGLIDKNGKILGKKQDVWNHVKTALNDEMSSDLLYVYFHQNRYNCRDAYCEQYNVQLSINTAISEEDEDSPNDESAEDQPEMRDFEIEISWDVWVKYFKPIRKTYRKQGTDSERAVMILPPYKWEHQLCLLISAKYKLPCAYSMKHSYVYTSNNSEMYIKIEAVCKECKCTATGIVLKEPREGQPAKLTWKAPNTINIVHTQKRFLAGERRVVVGQALVHGQSSSELRKEMANDLMDVGDMESPLLPSGPVLRKCKQQAMAKKLKTPTGSNVAENLQIMKCAEPFAGSIHTIAKDKFFVHYFSPSQMQIYKAFCKTEYPSVSIDATGKVVSRLATPLGKSGHIFLYEMVIRSDKYQLPVLQMLSEKQDANSILYWLNEWLRAGAPPPKQVVIDNSPALKSAVVRAFSGCCDLATYKKQIFLMLSSQNGWLPSCFLRLDVSHFLSAAAKWDVWKNENTKRLKQFFLHCLGLLIKTTSLEDFKFIFINVLTVAGSSHEGEGESESVTSCLNALSDLIKGSDIPCNEEEGAEDDMVEDEEPNQVCTEVQDFIFKMEEESMGKRSDEGRLNPYYSPTVEKEFLRIANDFVLWTGVAVKLFKSPHEEPPGKPKVTESSAPSESDFSALKRNILRGVCGLLRADKLVALHLQSIEGSCRIAGAEQRKISLSDSTNNANNNSNENGDSIDPDDNNRNGDSINPDANNDLNDMRDDDCEDTPGDLSNLENWRGLALIPKRRKKESRYLNPNPAFEVAVQNQQLKVPRRTILKNGNNMPFHEMDEGNHIMVINTCPFDVLCQILASSYINYQSVRELHRGATDNILWVSKCLAVEGAIGRTYVQRAHLLSKIMSPSGAPSSTGPISRSRNRSILQLVFDCFVTLQEMAEKVLGGVCQVSVKATCSEGCNISEDWLLLPGEADVLSSLGIKEMQQSVNLALGLQEGLPHRCNDVMKLAANDIQFLPSSPYLFFDIDIYSRFQPEDNSYVFVNVPLRDIPVELSFAGQRYILSGVVARQPPNHYVALCRAFDGKWTMFNNLKNYPQSVAENAEISPICLCFVHL